MNPNIAALPPEVQLRYKEKVDLIGGEDPYTVSKQVMLSDPECFPSGLRIRQTSEQAVVDPKRKRSRRKSDLVWGKREAETVYIYLKPEELKYLSVGCSLYRDWGPERGC